VIVAGAVAHGHDPVPENSTVPVASVVLAGQPVQGADTVAPLYGSPLEF